MITRKWGALLPALLILNACDTNDVAGTNNETHTKGTFFQANGKPAVGARVRVYAATQAESDSIASFVTQDTVDENGNVSLQLRRGHYSLIADDSARMAAVFIDSIFSDGDKIEIPVDTLRPTGTITGHVSVQPMHSPSIAWVHLMRTNLFTNVDSTGFFKLQGVPFGALDLVAATHLTEYTPTHRQVRALPDTSVEVGTLNLVFNGLPLVTGIAASYDTLSGVVTLTWHDTAYARKAGYIIYRQNGPASWLSPSVQGYSESAAYRDTVFGGFGVSPNRYDSIELDLTYWVGASATGYAPPGPLWNKVTLHVKSPALAKRWNVSWEAPIILSGNPTDRQAILDTLQTGLAILDQVYDATSPYFNRHQLRILQPSGAWSQFTLPRTSITQCAPVFWKGRIWRVEGRGFRGEFLDTSIFSPEAFASMPGNKLHTPWFDSLEIFSSTDGKQWDSSSLAIERDSVTDFRLQPTAENLNIITLTRHYYDINSMTGWKPTGRFSSPTGSLWTDHRAPNPALEGSAYNPLNYGYESVWSNSLIATDDHTDWSLYSRTGQAYAPGYWLIPGISIDTSQAVFSSLSSDPLKMRGTSTVMALESGTHFGLATPTSLELWQRLSPPEPIQAFCFWQGKLVVLGEKNLHIATITPNN